MMDARAAQIETLLNALTDERSPTQRAYLVRQAVDAHGGTLMEPIEPITHRSQWKICLLGLTATGASFSAAVRDWVAGADQTVARARRFRDHGEEIAHHTRDYGR